MPPSPFFNATTSNVVATDLRRGSVGFGRFELFEQSEFSNLPKPTLSRIKSVAGFCSYTVAFYSYFLEERPSISSA